MKNWRNIYLKSFIKGFKNDISLATILSALMVVVSFGYYCYINEVSVINIILMIIIPPLLFWEARISLNFLILGIINFIVDMIIQKINIDNKKKNIINIIRLIVVLVITPFLLYNIYQNRFWNVDRKEYENMAIEELKNDIGNERFELVSTEKNSDFKKTFYFRSLDRDVEYQIEVFISDSYKDYIGANQRDVEVESNYDIVMDNIYNSKFYEAVKRYCPDENTCYIKNGNIHINIHNRQDVEKYILIANELNNICSFENQFHNNKPSGYDYIRVYTYIYYDNDNHIDNNYININGDTIDLREDITNKINSVLEDNNITLE